MVEVAAIKVGCRVVGLERDGFVMIRKAVALDPNRAIVYAQRGFTRLLQDRRTEAEKDFRRAIQLEPTVQTVIDEQVAQIKHH